MKTVIFLGQSGSGKNFIAKKFMEKLNNECEFIKYATTRSIRENDIDNERNQYDFYPTDISEEEWNALPLMLRAEYHVNEKNDNGDIVNSIWRYGMYTPHNIEDKIYVSTNIPSIAASVVAGLIYKKIYLVYIYIDDNTLIKRAMNRFDNKYTSDEHIRRIKADKNKYKLLDNLYYISKERHLLTNYGNMSSELLVDKDEWYKELDKLNFKKADFKDLIPVNLSIINNSLDDEDMLNFAIDELINIIKE